MLVIFNGKTPDGLDAGIVQRAVEKDICACEHGMIQEAKECCYEVKTRLETKAEVITRLATEQNAGEAIITDILTRIPKSFDIKPQRVTIGREKMDIPDRKILISPKLKLTNGAQVGIDDFPDGHDFGNGVSVNTSVRLSDGNIHYMSWMVFPDHDEALVKSSFNKLRVLIEQ